MHIPKTGGTSVRNAAAEFFGEASMLYDYGPKAPATSPIVRALRYESEEPARLGEWIRTNTINFISGHFKVDFYTSLLPEAKAITWLRDPAERVRSLHQHRSLNHDETETLDAFSARPPFRNGMTDQAGSDLDAYAAVGVLEHHVDSLAMLNATLGIDLDVRRDNTGTLSPDIDESLRQRINNRNRKDVALVAEATRRLVAQHQTP